jgi:heat shock protein HtpX
VAGAAALAGGLDAVHRGGIAFEPYWSSEVVPVLSAGFLPPLAKGFDLFLKHPQVAAQVEKSMAAEAREGAQDPYDTHPSLHERLRALGNPAIGRSEEEPFAIALLENVKELESALLAQAAGDAAAARALKPVAWDEVGGTVYAPMWESFLSKHGRGLSGLTPSQLATVDWVALGKKVAATMEAHDGSDPAGLATSAVGMAVAVALLRRGFVIDTSPGATVRLIRGDERVEPFLLRDRLENAAGEWRELCERVGIATLDLARATDPSPA